MARITELQGRSLNAVDESNQNLAQLDDQVAQTRDLGNQIKRRIEALKKQPVPRGQEARRNQVLRLSPLRRSLNGLINCDTPNE